MQEPDVIGIISDIQRMCINDGPGFRTVVFLKGCNLSCQWCHNPEGKRRFPEIITYIKNCVGCNDCLEVCPTGALSLTEAGKPKIDLALCNSCFQCVAACRHNALVVWGKMVTVKDVIPEVLADKPFYVHSGGGLTLSGGDPMAQVDFGCALMESAKKNGINTALDTCGHTAWENFERILEYTDLVLYDLKIMDSNQHRKYSGVGNELILENVKRIAAAGLKLRIRIPIIPGRNNTDSNWQATAKFIDTLGPAVLGIDLLPYHPFAGSKYESFGLQYPFPKGEGLEDKSIEPILKFFVEHAPEVTVGG